MGHEEYERSSTWGLYCEHPCSQTLRKCTVAQLRQSESPLRTCPRDTIEPTLCRAVAVCLPKFAFAFNSLHTLALNLCTYSNLPHLATYLLPSCATPPCKPSCRSSHRLSTLRNKHPHLLLHEYPVVVCRLPRVVRLSKGPVEMANELYLVGKGSGLIS